MYKKAVPVGVENFEKIIKVLENGDIKKFEKTLGKVMINMLSHFGLKSEMKKIYQVFMIGLVVFFDGNQIMRADMEDTILQWYQ